MKLSYTNSQTFAVSAMFPIKQRKLAWLLRKHPKKFRHLRGPDWHFVYHHDLSDPEVDLELFKEGLDKQILDAFKGIQVYHAEKRRRAAA